MKKIASLFLTLLLVLCVFLALPINVSAASFETQDGFEVTITTDKTEYTANEDIQVKVNIKNNNTYKAEDISIETLLPEGLVLKNGNLTATDIDIEAGASYSASVVANLSDELKNNEETKPDDATKPEATAKPQDTTKQVNTTKPSNLQDTNVIKTGNEFNTVLWIVLLVVAAACIFLAVKYKKTTQMMSLFLCFTMVLTMLPMTAFAAENDTATITVDKTVTVDGKQYFIQVNVVVPNDSLSTTCVVSFNTNGGNAIKSQTINKGATATIPIAPEKEGFAFVGWYVDNQFSELFDFSKPISNSCTVFARWVDITDTTDTDGDGLTDAVEEFYGTNISLVDTDEDGLSDYIEIAVINYNPLNKDTDNDDVLDGQEDCDNDAIDNKTETDIGTDPSMVDTDGDDLTDKAEVDTYMTDPTVSDTDNDGANDGWEVNNRFDPLVFNNSFNVEITVAETIEENNVVASVEIEAAGSQASSLKVQSVTKEEEPLLSESIPGYLGTAYDFSINGEITSALISFEYDTSLGTISDNFQPRIYYFNEDNGTLEELENQIVTDGKVSAEVPHFSKYILLNKTEFDKVWEAEIKPPLSSGDPDDEATLDIIFVIDYSLSMDENDPYQLFKDLSEEFVNKLRDGKDKAGAVKFIRRATLVSALTTNKESVIAAINGISYDNGYGTYSGTDGSAGIKMALDQMATSDSEYQYIVFITDGEDNGYSYSYDSLIATANESDVTIYAVGMGSASESVLKKVSSQTGGKYYHATTGVSVDDLINLDDVFEDIESETIDLTTDSNEDNIPDYYNNLIKEGILLLSNGSNRFAGIDFNSNEDYDGDGILNGDELHIIQSGTAVYMEMKSDPTRIDTDGDGYVDNDDNNALVWNVSDRDLAMFAALTYETPQDYSNKSIDDSYFFLNYASANEVYDYWRIVDCSGERWADVATHFYATTYKNGNNIVIAYRGTDGEWGEWVNNVVGVGLVNYHSEEGYATSYANKIANQYPNCNIYITGHSLGGYLAQFGASEIILNHNVNNLKKVAYFNGIGLKYNKLLFWTKNDVMDALKNYYNGDTNNPNLISYNVYGDVVSALGIHSGSIISYLATSDAINQHKGKYGSGGLTDFLSKSAAGWLTILSSENIAYYYNYYDCSSVMEYFWITHETDSFFYHLTAGTRNHQ